MLMIPINDVVSQTLTVVLKNQACRINLYQKTTDDVTSILYCDLYVNDALIVGGIICRNLTKIVRDKYLGFIGDLMFQDIQLASDPSSPGLGSRYVFCYIETV